MIIYGISIPIFYNAIILHQFVAVSGKAEGKKQLYKLPQFIIFNYFWHFSA